jgi:hypothetical protein
VLRSFFRSVHGERFAQHSVVACRHEVSAAVAQFATLEAEMGCLGSTASRASSPSATAGFGRAACRTHRRTGEAGVLPVGFAQA